MLWWKYFIQSDENVMIIVRKDERQDALSSQEPNFTSFALMNHDACTGSKDFLISLTELHELNQDCSLFRDFGEAIQRD